MGITYTGARRLHGFLFALSSKFSCQTVANGEAGGKLAGFESLKTFERPFINRGLRPLAKAYDIHLEAYCLHTASWKSGFFMSHAANDSSLAPKKPTSGFHSGGGGCSMREWTALFTRHISIWWKWERDIPPSDLSLLIQGS